VTAKMKRRAFITLLGGAAAWSLAARAQQPGMPVIGFLSSGSQQSDVWRLIEFRRGLSETGYVEGRNVMSRFSWADEQYDRLPALATELARSQPAVQRFGQGLFDRPLASRVLGAGGPPVRGPLPPFVRT
jgi:hypothetical protein